MDAVEPLIIAKPVALAHVLEKWGAPAGERPPSPRAQLDSKPIMWPFGPVGFREPPGLERFSRLPASTTHPREPCIPGQVSEQSLALGSFRLRLSV
mmetsp:Transcript_73951/g.214187  ORF Transcript_73951/g.214187 Transcript_73951/m.214187 type:complete len:96 (+) Transcript_73951:1-288(+)